MLRIPGIVSLPVAIALFATGCSSSRQRTDLGSAPTPPAPVYREPIERPYQPAVPAYQPHPQPTHRSYAPAPATNRHIVRPGDTLYGISRRYNVSVAGLIQANRLPSTAVYPGQSLVIPR